MKNIVNSYVEKFKGDHRTARRTAALLLMLALLVTGGVFWRLHSTGIALANETFCGLEEHTHTEDCYDEDGNLICGLEEHTHSLSCLSDTSADTETASDWEATIPDDLSGTWADDVVAIAESQLGYTESTANFTVTEDGETRQGYTRYGAWAGNDYGDWDAMFASFCLSYAGISTEDFPESTGAYAWAVLLKNAGLYEAAADYTPVTGDLVFLDTDSDEKIDRVGILVSIDEENNTLTLIEGDYAAAEDDTDAVCEVSYAADDSSIIGYGTVAVAQEIAETAQTPMLTADGDTGSTNSMTLTTTYEDTSGNTATLTIFSSSDNELLTGQYASISVMLGLNGDTDLSEQSIRVYLTASESDMQIFGSTSGTDAWEVGETRAYTITDKTTTVDVTLCQDADGYYLEIDSSTMVAGDTVNFNISVGYPNESSDGGTVAVSGAIGNNQTGSATYTWTTHTDTYGVTKSNSGNAAFVSNTNDDEIYLTGLAYTLHLTKISTYSDYGKDPITKVVWTDTLTLPDGLSWREGLLTAIQNGDYQIVSATQGKAINVTIGSETYTLCTLKHGMSDAYNDVQITVVGNVIQITWTTSYDGSVQTEDNNALKYSTTVTYGDNVIVCDKNGSGTYDVNTYKLSNTVQTDYSFKFSSEVQSPTATAETSGTLSEGTLELTKEADSTEFYMGASNTYTVTVENVEALPYYELQYIEDTLNSWLYIEPQDMEALFTEYGDSLTITISNATLYKKVSHEVTNEEGDTKYVTQQEEGTNTSYTGNKVDDSGTLESSEDTSSILASDATITLTQVSTDMLQMTVAYGSSSTTYTIGTGGDYTSIETALDEIGYYVTSDVLYTLLWDLGNGYIMAGNSSRTYTYNATVKDTFMSLSGDRFYDYRQSGSEDWTKDDVEITTADLNTASAYGSDYGTTGVSPLVSATLNGTVYRDFVLTKDYTVSGGSTASTGDIVTYTVKVKHEGNAEYDALPLVDQLGAGQVLLVPASLNIALADRGLTEKTVDGTVYYVLDQVGTYSDISINSDVVADTIVVDNDGKARIYCYLTVSGNQTKSITYKTLITEDTSGTSGFSLKNQVWLNDHETHRLYAETSVDGSVLSIDKQIVTEQGSKPSEDVTTTYSILSNSGQTVTYRLELKNNSDNALTVTGANVYDALPFNVSGNPWEKSDISILVDATSAADVSARTADIWDDSNMWSVTTVAPGTTDAEDSSATQCYLVWDDSLSVTFTGSIYIYVTLTYPDGDDWIAYYNAYKSAELVNTFHAYALEAQVSHTISSETKATLFKGVYATGLASGTTYNSSFYSYGSTKDNSLTYYTNNSAGEYGYVEYYVVLYNEGPVNLYLQDMTDILPDGFSYISGSADAASGITVQNTAGETMTLISDYTVTGTANSSDGTVTFSLSGGSLAKDTADLYYLAPGEAIVFTYKVLTNAYSSTSDTEINTITMPFYDYTEGGISVSDDVSGDTVTGSWYDANSNPKNDGDTEVWDATEAGNAGLDTTGTTTQWLASSVSVYRGEIRPGITKSATADKAGESDVITWNVTVTNDGENTMTDYYIYDEIELPYTFYSSTTTAKGTYSLTYTVYDGNGNSTTYLLGNFYNLTDSSWSFYHYSSSTSNSMGLLKSSNSSSLLYGTTMYTAYGKALAASNKEPTGTRIRYQIGIKKTDDGNLVLMLRFAYYGTTDIQDFAIPSGGYGVLTVSTKNETSVYENGTVTNSAYIRPTQTFSQYHIGKGIEVPADSGDDVVSNYHAVKTEAMIPVNYGSATTSSKSVSELDTSGNVLDTAISSGSLDILQLTSSSSTIQYTLTVTNGETEITKLVLVDNLPENNDTDPLTDAQRYSDFTVKLADVPNFKVTVTYADNATITLDEKYYTIVYSDYTSFTDDDLDGTDETKWYPAQTDSTRSFRITLNFDDTFTSIPANATVSVSFNAVIHGAATGGVAWNSFSYLYALGGQPGVTATPLPVGIKAPSVPVLEKQVLDGDGNVESLDAAKEYSFLIYEGSELSDVDSSDMQALLEALFKNNITFTEVTLKVEAGGGTAGMSLENLVKYTVSEDSGIYSVTAGTDSWSWTNNHNYTIVELTQDETYPFRSWNSTVFSNSYTFTYQNNTVLELICNNQVETYELPSAGGAGTVAYTAAGLALLGGTALLLGRRRRRARRESI